jgi:2-hydroxychromene-2-carboxylate isomerase
VNPRFYFSFRSPYSWLAYRDLTARHPQLCDRLSWVPFWEPDEQLRTALAEAGEQFPYVDMSRAKSRYILQDVRRLARARGIVLAWPVDRQPHWEVAHLAYLLAAQQGHGPAFVERVYAARWEQGRDISDPATIADIAAGLGQDPEPYASVAADPRLRVEALDILLDVVADGVFGVPFFVHGQDRYWGVERLEEFVAALRAGPDASQTTPDIAASAPGAEQGHAGGCG